jgi:hypothetical protein
VPVGAAIGISGVVGAGANLIGSQQQASAANRAADLQQQQYQQSRTDLMPYNTAGQNATNMLTAALPTLTAPIAMDEGTLRNTPGYQFNLTQGLKSTQNSAAARGLGSSGAALKGAATYATGLADNTYQNQFNNAVTNQTNAYNRLMGVAGLGENAAAQSGNIGVQGAANAGNSLIGAGTASAAGLTGAANSLTNGANSYAGYTYANQNNALMSPGLYGNSGWGG